MDTLKGRLISSKPSDSQITIMSDLAEPPEDVRGDGDRGGSKSRRDRSRSRDKERCVWAPRQLLPFCCFCSRQAPGFCSMPDSVAVPGAKPGVTRRSTSGGTGAGPGRSAGERSHWHTHRTLRSHSCQTAWDTVTTSHHVRPHTYWTAPTPLQVPQQRQAAPLPQPLPQP